MMEAVSTFRGQAKGNGLSGQNSQNIHLAHQSVSVKDNTLWEIFFSPNVFISLANLKMPENKIYSYSHLKLCNASYTNGQLLPGSQNYSQNPVNIKLEKEKGRRRGEKGLLTTGTANSSADHFSFTYNLCEDKTYIQTIYIAAPTYFNSSILLFSCQSIENLR